MVSTHQFTKKVLANGSLSALNSGKASPSARRSCPTILAERHNLTAQLGFWWFFGLPFGYQTWKSWWMVIFNPFEYQTVLQPILCKSFFSGEFNAMNRTNIPSRLSPRTNDDVRQHDVNFLIPQKSQQCVGAKTITFLAELTSTIMFKLLMNFDVWWIWVFCFRLFKFVSSGTSGLHPVSDFRQSPQRSKRLSSDCEPTVRTMASVKIQIFVQHLLRKLHQCHSLCNKLMQLGNFVPSSGGKCNPNCSKPHVVCTIAPNYLIYALRTYRVVVCRGTVVHFGILLCCKQSIWHIVHLRCEHSSMPSMLSPRFRIDFHENAKTIALKTIFHQPKRSGSWVLHSQAASST